MFWGRHKRILTTEQVQEIVERKLIDGERPCELADEFGITQQHVHHLCIGGSRKAETYEIRERANQLKSGRSQ